MNEFDSIFQAKKQYLEEYKKNMADNEKFSKLKIAAMKKRIELDIRQQKEYVKALEKKERLRQEEKDARFSRMMAIMKSQKSFTEAKLKKSADLEATIEAHRRKEDRKQAEEDRMRKERLKRTNIETKKYLDKQIRDKVKVL